MDTLKTKFIEQVISGNFAITKCYITSMYALYELCRNNLISERNLSISYCLHSGVFKEPIPLNMSVDDAIKFYFDNEESYKLICQRFNGMYPYSIFHNFLLSYNITFTLSKEKYSQYDLHRFLTKEILTAPNIPATNTLIIVYELPDHIVEIGRRQNLLGGPIYLPTSVIDDNNERHVQTYFSNNDLPELLKL